MSLENQNEAPGQQGNLPKGMAWRMARKKKSRYPLRKRVFPASTNLTSNETTQEKYQTIDITAYEQKIQNFQDVIKNNEIEYLEKIGKLQIENKSYIERIDRLESMVSDAREILQKNKAEMDGLRKRTKREIEQIKEYASEGIITKLLSVIDHFNLAIESAKDSQETESIIKGIVLIKKEMESILESEGVSPILALNELFDPNLHDAVSTSNDPEFSENIITEVLRPGWKIKDKVIRPSIVVVNKTTGSKTEEV